MKYLIPVARTADGRMVCRVVKSNPLTRGESAKLLKSSRFWFEAAMKRGQVSSLLKHNYLGNAKGLAESVSRMGQSKQARETADKLIARVKKETTFKHENPSSRSATTPRRRSSSSGVLERLRKMRAAGKGGSKEYMALMRGLRKRNPVEVSEVEGSTLTVLENPTTAEKILKSFHGHVTRETRVRMPKIPTTAYEVGKLEAVIYRPPQGSKIGATPRIHHFGNPQPRLLGFTHNPPWVIMGGKAKFTYRGFIG